MPTDRFVIARVLTRRRAVKLHVQDPRKVDAPGKRTNLQAKIASLRTVGVSLDGIVAVGSARHLQDASGTNGHARSTTDAEALFDDLCDNVRGH